MEKPRTVECLMKGLTSMGLTSISLNFYQLLQKRSSLRNLILKLMIKFHTELSSYEILKASFEVVKPSVLLHFKNLFWLSWN